MHREVTVSASTSQTSPFVIRQLGLVDYESTFAAMQAFTAARQPDTPDELWVLQHPPVFTQGLAGKPEHVLQLTPIPIVQTDRGGQVTYHGPGQLVVYLLLKLDHYQLSIRELVRAIEQAVIDLLAEYGIRAYGKVDAPGVYVDEAKVASIGLRVKHGCTYHGVSLNIDMDMAPFNWINPCGYANMRMTQLRELGVTERFENISERFLAHLHHTIAVKP